MDLNTESGTLHSHAAFEESVLEQEPSPSSSHSQPESGGAILLELLEFKTLLQEVVEELHIRRDAETRFEDQIRQLVLDKQELEWLKESLQQQIETRTKQHTESLTAVNKEFQVKLQHLEVEKGKYQVAAELKDKMINNLKEEVKSLQLLRYTLEKKSSELEQKLALQSQTKDTYLNQLGEVEKRFRTLSRQCAAVKQAHEKLEQNVDEAMKINNKLTSANQKQEDTIVTLKKELDEVGYKLIKEKMKSVITEKDLSPTAREQILQEQQQKLELETEMNKKLRKENVAERAEKQELMRSLQNNQQLLLNQTQTVKRLELELQTQSEMFQALKQEHEVMREKSKAMEGKLVQLTESCSASKTSWDKEKTKFLDQLEREQKDLKVVREAYEALHQKHAELSEKIRSRAQHTDREEVKGGSQSHCISTNQFPMMMKDIGDEETLEEPVSDPRGVDHLQLFDSSQPKTVDYLRDIGAAFQLAASRAGQDVQSHQQQPQIIKRILNHPNTFPDRSTDCVSLLNNSETATGMEVLERNMKKCETKDLIVSDEGHQSASNPECGSATLLTKNTQVKDGGNAEEKGVIAAQTAEGTDMHEDTEGSAKATGETSNPETERRDKRDGVKERGQTGELTTSETLIQAPTISDTTGESQTLQVIDFMDTELPLTVCEPSSSSESLSQKVTDEHEDCNHSNKKLTVNRKECQISSDKQQSVSNKSSSDTANVQPDLPDEVQAPCQDVEPVKNQQSSSVCQNPEYENPSKETAEDFSAECSEILKQSSTCVSGTGAGQSEKNSVQEHEAGQTRTDICNPSYIVSIMRKSDEQVTDTQPQSQETSEQQHVKHFQLNVNTHENNTAQIPEDPVVPSGNTQEEIKTDTGDEEVTKTEAGLKISEEPSHENGNLKETDRLKHRHHHVTLRDSSEGFLSTRKTSRSLFECGSTQRRTSSSRTNPDNSKLQGTCVFGPDRTGRPLTIPTFIRSKHNKAPLVITRASDLFNPPSVTGAAAYSKVQQQEKKLGEEKEETCRETAAADTDRRALLSFSSPLVSSAGSKESRLTSSECSRAAAGPSSESDQELPCSQNGEDQQSSFRAQISKIEQFLNSEKLRLPKRRRIEN